MSSRSELLGLGLDLVYRLNVKTLLDDRAPNQLLFSIKHSLGIDCCSDFLGPTQQQKLPRVQPHAVDVVDVMTPQQAALHVPPSPTEHPSVVCIARATQTNLLFLPLRLPKMAAGDPLQAEAPQDHHAGGGRARLRVPPEGARRPQAGREGHAALRPGTVHGII